MTDVKGKRVKSTEGWGTDTARERYGFSHKTPEMSRGGHESAEPQKLGDKNTQRDPKYHNDVKSDWRRGMPNGNPPDSFYATPAQRGARGAANRDVPPQRRTDTANHAGDRKDFGGAE